MTTVDVYTYLDNYLVIFYLISTNNSKLSEYLFKIKDCRYLAKYGLKQKTIIVQLFYYECTIRVNYFIVLL